MHDEVKGALLGVVAIAICIFSCNYVIMVWDARIIPVAREEQSRSRSWHKSCCFHQYAQCINTALCCVDYAETQAWQVNLVHCAENGA